MKKLGKSHEQLRLEKMRFKDLQGQVEMLNNTLLIMETSLQQVKKDKVSIENENRRLKDYLCSKDIDISVEEYRDFVDRKNESLGGRDTIQAFEKDQEESRKKLEDMQMRRSIESKKRS